MSRVLFKKRNPQQLAAFREGHSGLKHGKQAWEDQVGGPRVMRYYNAYLPQGTSWDDRWVSVENFIEFESARRSLRVRHRKGEHIEQAMNFEEILQGQVASNRGKLPEGESCQPPVRQKTESVGRRGDNRIIPGASGLAAYG